MILTEWQHKNEIYCNSVLFTMATSVNRCTAPCTLTLTITSYWASIHGILCLFIVCVFFSTSFLFFFICSSVFSFFSFFSVSSSHVPLFLCEFGDESYDNISNNRFFSSVLCGICRVAWWFFFGSCCVACNINWWIRPVRSCIWWAQPHFEKNFFICMFSRS